MKSFFITGTDTDVGKTIVSTALLIHAAKTAARICYVKPIQTGSPDIEIVQTYIKSYQNIRTSCGIALKRPISPHLAAHYQSTHISFPSVMNYARNSLLGDFNVVEGAGGLMVPINGRYYIIDLIKALSLPCILVARSTLGTINHTLLSIEALRARDVPLWGVVMVGHYNRDNEASIKHYGRIENVMSLPWLARLDQESLSNVIEAQKCQFDRFLNQE